MMRGLLVGLLCAGAAFAQQALYVQNAAAFSLGVAPGSLVSLTPGRGDLLADLSRATVEFQSQDFGPVTARAFPNDFRILAVVPGAMPLGPAVVRVVVDGTARLEAPVEIVTAAVGIFMRFGIGPALAQNVDAAGQVSLNQLTNPALPGQFVTLWATGLGKFRAADVRLTLAGQSIQPVYAGPSPGLPGVDQINFAVPSDTPDGCYLPLTIWAGQSFSNQATVAKATSPGSCPHPLGLSAEELRSLDAGRSIQLGYILLGSIVTPASGPGGEFYQRREIFNANFQGLSQSTVFSLTGSDVSDPSASTCELSGPPSSSAQIIALSGSSPPITLKGPGGRQVEIASFTSGLYFQELGASGMYPAGQLPLPFLVPGTWEMAMSDGPFGSFQWSIVLPPQIRWRDPNSLRRIDRSADLLVAWEASGYSSAQVMSIELRNGSTIPTPGARAVAMNCTAPAQAGRVVLPASLLSQIAPTAGSASGQLTLRVRPRPSSLSRSPVISYTFSDTISVIVR